MAATLEHKGIGSITGKQAQGVVQYLSVKYGDIQDRFANATFPSYPSSTPIDATTHGPYALQPPNAVDMEQGLIQHTLPVEHRDVTDLDSLVLNISVPEGTSSTSKLPVFAFIHGGGFAIGSTSWPQYDGARLVRLSVKQGTPIIVVGINYRVGIPGFLTSSAMEKAGYKPNRGLYDQRLALQWLKKYIAGFGGDPDAISLGGESAGGVSVAYHMRSEEPLFKRAIPMSGSDFLMKASPKSDDAFEKLCSILGLEGKMADEQVTALRDIPGLELIQKVGRSVQTVVVLDDDLITYNRSYEGLMKGTEKIEAAAWLDGLLLGDCAFDGGILSLAMGPHKPKITERFISALSALDPPTADRLQQIYDINPSTPADDAFPRALRFLNDIKFYAPTLAYASNLTAKSNRGKPGVYSYRFNTANPWDGPSKGQANHILDVAFLFQNFNDHLPEKQVRVAEQMGEAFIAFVAGKSKSVNGKEWTPQSASDKKALVFGDDGLSVLSDVPSETGRNAAFLELASEVGFDALTGVSVRLLNG